MVEMRKQVLVQLDEGLVERLDEAATRLGVSRSELLRRAAEAWLEAQLMVEADLELIAAYARAPQDPELIAAAAQLAAVTAAES
jgi:metal-responsive CopG/Arc/MetJ family transcriptional regulator